MCNNQFRIGGNQTDHIEAFRAKEREHQKQLKARQAAQTISSTANLGGSGSGEEPFVLDDIGWNEDPDADRGVRPPLAAEA